MNNTGVTQNEYNDMLRRLKSAEIERNRLARELRTVIKRHEIDKLSIETQTELNKNISDEKHRQEMYIRLLMESSPGPMIIFDEAGRFLLGAKSVTEIIGVEDMSILQGRTLDNIVRRYAPSVFTADITAFFNAIIVNGGAVDMDQRFEVSMENQKYELRMLSFFNDDGMFSGILIYLHDITEILRSKELAERASMAKGEFLSRMSHEMRTPMNAIIGMTNIAKNSGDPARKEYCLDKIESASKHLLGVINDILDMSKIEANKFELTYSAFDFEKMLMNVTNVVNFPIEEKHQKLVITLDESIPKSIVSDEFRLTQVITNLLTNAIKFTPDGGLITLVATDIPAVDGGRTLQVEVADNGIGISAEQQSRLFTSFEQADGGIGRKYGGTGLGLAICKKITEMMGGRIWIESELGKGAKFIFTINYRADASVQPDFSDKNTGGALNGYTVGSYDGQAGGRDGAGSNAQAGGAAQRSNVQAGGAAQRSTETVAYKNHTILVAEDIDINREIMQAFLEETGVTVEFAETGLEAVMKFSRRPDKYSMIFMDIHMPEMNGYDATRSIRASEHSRAKTIPIVAMTANVFKEDIERCLESGMNSHLGKPVDVNALYKTLDFYLSNAAQSTA